MASGFERHGLEYRPTKGPVMEDGLISKRHEGKPVTLPGTSAISRPLRKVPILNAFVHDVTMDELVENFDRGRLLTLHVDMLIKLQKDRAFYDILDRFDVVTCDSQIMYFALKFLGTPISERVSGSDFFPRFYMRHRDNPDVTVFILGGKPGIAEIAARNINEKAGREIIIDTYSPPFGFEQDPAEVDKVVDRINASGATVLFVAMSGGTQEKFIIDTCARLPEIRLTLPLGGTVDYEARTLKRPPAWVTNAGFEWFYRVLKEPRLRWKRYFIHQTPFLWLALKQKLGMYRDPFG